MHRLCNIEVSESAAAGDDVLGREISSRAVTIIPKAFIRRMEETVVRHPGT